MKRTKLSRQFLLNYIFIFIILIVFVVMVFFFNTTYLNNVHTVNFDFEAMENDYLNFDIKTALANQKLESEDQLIVLDKDRFVIDSTSPDINIGSQLSSETYNYYFIDNPEYDHLVYYLKSNKDHFFILRYYMYVEYTDILFPLSLLFASFFIVFTVYFARTSSQKIVFPLVKLQEGVQKIKSGNLEHIIEFDANNELDILKDTINLLAHELKDEIIKRQHVEANRQSLIRNVSHDIKTPLTNIIGYSDTLIDSNQNLTTLETEKALQLINRYGKHADHLVDELFQLSSLELKENQSYPVADFAEFIRENLIQYIDDFEMNHIQYDFDIPDDVISFAFDSQDMKRVLDNLIHNSLKYNKENFTMKVYLRNLDEYILLIVEDDGIGIPKAFQNTIFEPSVRVNTSRSTEVPGSGIGLAIVKQVLENHNGQIRLDTTHPGAKFIIELKKRS